jgi:2-oxoglutarate dehydrogenase E2 component (dihydrolipoamide succinyltransferase)
MASFKVVMPKLGESIIEATITRWLKSEGDAVEEDDSLVEIATDKVDSEIPSPVAGKISKLHYKEGDVVAVGEVIAIIDIDGDNTLPEEERQKEKTEPHDPVNKVLTVEIMDFPGSIEEKSAGRFYSPLIRNIAKQENIPLTILESLPGSGKDNRLTKQDLLQYLAIGTQQFDIQVINPDKTNITGSEKPPVQTESGDETIEMDRMRKLIADHMVNSIKTSPHVTSVVEVDMTKIVKWREKVKESLLKRYNEKLTFTHIFIEAIAKTISDFPMVNSSVSGNSIILKKNINIGMAVALPSGNLIVPVIRNVNQKSLLGIVKEVNDIAERARHNKLQPDEVQGGTITLTNLGSFGTLFGTPIINQPQLAIVAVGSITKRPVVIETAEGDVIAVRHMMYLSLSYDHRVIDGALGGRFIYRMKELLENFDTQMNF